MEKYSWPPFENSSGNEQRLHYHLGVRQIELLEQQLEFLPEQQRIAKIQESSTIAMKKATVAIAVIAGMQVAILIAQIVIALTTEPKAILIERPTPKVSLPAQRQPMIPAANKP